MKSWPLYLLCISAASGIGGLRPAAALGAPASTADTPPAAHAPLNLAALAPYFDSDAEGPRRLAAGDHAAAVKALEAYLKDHPKAKDLDQARFLLGVARVRLLKDQPQPAAAPAKKHAAKDATTDAALQAARDFDRLAKPYPLLSDYHRLYAARAYLLAHKPKEALERAHQITVDSVLACEAYLLRGESQHLLGQLPAAADEYRGYLDTCTGKGTDLQSRHQAQARLAGIYVALGKSPEAVKLYRALYLEAPTEAHGAQAEQALQKPGAPGQTYTPQELLGRAQILFDNMRNQESEAAYQQILALPELTPAARCVARFHLAQSVFKQRQRPRAAPLFDQAVKDCGPDGARNDDLHMRSMYQGARCHGSKGELQQAADLFAQAEAAHPEHSFADDSRVRQAEMYADLRDRLAKVGAQDTCKAKTCPDYEARLTELLKDLPERYPGGDQRAEALWRLSFHAYRKRDFPQARAYLEDALRRVPREVGWDQEGRTLYWLGRLAEIGKDQPGAISFYRRTATEYPLSYYTLMALNRLRELAPPELDRLLGELTAEPAGEETEWRFAWRPLFDQPGFQRAVELMRLGLGSEARTELAAVGVRAPEGKGVKVASPEQEELLWLSAVLYHRARQWHLSHWIPRHTLTGYQRHYPVGAARKQWELSYPRGYEDLLVEAAKKNGQPAALQFAIVREESAFNPVDESFANAIGLTQMIPPTAKRFADGLPTTREALRDPAVNVAIGARFLGFLWSTMRGNPALAIPGYNAGENAVFRWLKDRGDMDLDAWIEAIPYDETRGYTKRVLSSYLTYAWLQPGQAPGAAGFKDRVPVLTLALPALSQVQGQKEAGKEEDPHRK